jgi:gamma-glutamyltranspeptidase
VSTLRPRPSKWSLTCRKETISAFEASDFQIHLLDGLSEKVGHANLITVDNGSFHVASDPRADGSAFAS